MTSDEIIIDLADSMSNLSHDEYVKCQVCKKYMSQNSAFFNTFAMESIRLRQCVKCYNARHYMNNICLQKIYEPQIDEPYIQISIQIAKRYLSSHHDASQHFASYTAGYKLPLVEGIEKYLVRVDESALESYYEVSMDEESLIFLYGTYGIEDEKKLDHMYNGCIYGGTILCTRIVGLKLIEFDS